MSPLRTVAIGIACAAALGSPGRSGAAFRLMPGDLLVADLLNARIPVVDRGTGAVQDFSPRSGSGDNLLVAPGRPRARL